MVILLLFQDPLKDDELSNVLVDLLEEAEKEGFEPVIEENGEIKMKPVGEKTPGASGIVESMQSNIKKMKSKVKAIIPVDGGEGGRKRSRAPASRQEEKHQVVELLMKREILQKTIHVSIILVCVFTPMDMSQSTHPHTLPQHRRMPVK